MCWPECGDLEPRRVDRPVLCDADEHRLALNGQNTLVGLSVPNIHLVPRSAPDRPSRQIEPEGRCRLKSEDDAAHPLTSNRPVRFCSG